MSSPKQHRVAIVGFGPRALGALEALTEKAVQQGMSMQVDIFDPIERIGAGPNYAPDQSALCILNIPARNVDYRPPALMAEVIPPFTEWSEGRFSADDFPPRAAIGTYLQDRYAALQRSVPASLILRSSTLQITDLKRVGQAWLLYSGDTELGPFDEVLLSQGQPETTLDPQLRRWENHAAAKGVVLRPAYPANDLISAAADWAGKTVAVRGLGLSTLDVIRMLTTGLGGVFTADGYTPSGREPRKILPFSLDGRPPVAKPASGALDRRYDLSDAELDAFEIAAQDAMQADPTESLALICSAMVATISRILSECGGLGTGEDIRRWLECERLEPGSQNTRGVVEGLRVDIDMAHGRQPPDIGYVAGQVWRKLQHALRGAFSQQMHDLQTGLALIGFDEAFKRYSYGPPVFAAEELLTLIDSGIVSLCTVDDPAVLLTETGWQLLEGDDAMSAPVMIDAVLPSPDLAQVKDRLITSCMHNGYATALADGMGAQTTPEGQLVDAAGTPVPGLCLLGRLALGSVIAVDGLADCFGPSADRWAAGVLRRRHAQL